VEVVCVSLAESRCACLQILITHTEVRVQAQAIRSSAGERRRSVRTGAAESGSSQQHQMDRRERAPSHLGLMVGLGLAGKALSTNLPNACDPALPPKPSNAVAGMMMLMRLSLRKPIPTRPASNLNPPLRVAHAPHVTHTAWTR
jgi:hypothetical protein